ncbi:hypothetical protein F8M41_014752 [Gigaspora margarita]|uniref:Uncharacterized protein n=1 Tax=Gigaspora margarita TaxID=4874 RepID=A0A8H4AR78_GIGMA|nr:hypothetical protein F8M41_014752 [Gigaspora margarita]
MMKKLRELKKIKKVKNRDISSTNKPEKSCLKHKKGRIENDDNGSIITEPEEINHTDYKEPFDNAIFGFNKKQENELEVLLEEISAEYDTLIQKLAPKEQELIQEFRGEIVVKKGKNKEVEFKIELSSAYLKLTEVNYAGKTKDPVVYQTQIGTKIDVKK